MRFTSLLVGVGDRRQPTPRPSPSQPTPNPSQEGRGEKGRERGGRSGRFVPRLFCPTMSLKYAPCMSVLDVIPGTAIRPQKGSCLYMSMLLDLISKP
ncbi:MAG: hypothetical protein F6K48_27960 [Okeania sp. SIO3H1]|nr:hypothetical protein [Okeania sp. SIO3H1]